MAVETRTVWFEGEMREITADWGEAPEHVADPIISPRTYKADIWRRASDAEAEVIDASLNAQPVKQRNLFRDAQYLSHDDPYFTELKAGFIQAFGEPRAGELLAPSE